MHKNDLNYKINQILKRETRYHREAYFFVSASVTYTTAKLAQTRHVNALELLKGISTYALKEFGPFYKDILQGWGIYKASDIGTIVYELIAEQALSASEDDSRDDFSVDYDLFAAAEIADSKDKPLNKKVPTID
ncbi:hypothetical protein P0136_11885 [Lentisphaerota bacterium ZTH]|nr:hypothetical protein JYG24_10600 [Lentisphaerota bacterium]WET06057.1 hypothetical protein P0136_11885 [Lentisphaerota bacterium ZTH]